MRRGDFYGSRADKHMLQVLDSFKLPFFGPMKPLVPLWDPLDLAAFVKRAGSDLLQPEASVL